MFTTDSAANKGSTCENRNGGRHIQGQANVMAATAKQMMSLKGG